MPFAVRPFERADRDQLTALVNAHVAAVLPGVGLSVNTVMSQLEREPTETIVDPWVAQRQCLVAIHDGALVAAALLHRFRSDDEVGPDYRGAGEIRWLVCRPTNAAAGGELMNACLAVFARWRVVRGHADGSLPALGCYGVPDSWPHIRALYRNAGFAPAREEIVLTARCNHLASAPSGTSRADVVVRRSVGLCGTRLELVCDDVPLGFIEVGEHAAGMARGTTATTWTDIGNLVVAEGADRAVVTPSLLSVAAEWLLLGGVERLIAYHSVDDDTPDELETLKRCGFVTLVTNQRGWRLP